MMKRLDDIPGKLVVVENGSNKTDVIGRRDSSTTVVDAITKRGVSLVIIIYKYVA